jgi:AAA domain/NrS-1  polymerase HBD domain
MERGMATTQELTTIDITLIPETMRNRPQWGVWARVEGKKLPYSPITHHITKPNSTKGWGTFEDACAALAQRPGYYAGLGFIFTEQDPYTGIDLDGCRNPATTEIAPWAQEIVARMASYAEVSPSGTGLHLIVQGAALQSVNWRLAASEGPEQKAPGIEIYSQAHYLTVTGDWLMGTPTTTTPRQDALNTLYADIATLRDLAKSNRWTRALIGGDIDRYHNDDSEAAYALIRDLTSVAGKDAERIERLFRLTRLHRAKDDEPRGNTTWLRSSIAKGIETYQSPGATQTPPLTVNGTREKAKQPIPEDSCNLTTDFSQMLANWPPGTLEEDDSIEVGEAEEAEEEETEAAEGTEDGTAVATPPTPPTPTAGEPPQRPDSTGGGEAPPHPRPASGAYSIRLLADIPMRQPEWLWEPYLPRGFLTILAGDGGTGKSTIASLIAARLTRGEHPYTGEPTGRCWNVLIATSEDDHSIMLKPRLMAYGANAKRIATIAPIPSLQEVEVWERLLKAGRPPLVIIDPIQEALGHKLDENRASQTRAAFRPLLPLAERYRCTFLFLAHLGKDAAERKAQHRVLGSVDIGAVTRSIMLIEESEPVGHYTITHVKSNLTGKGERLAYQIVPHEMQPGWVVGVAKWKDDPATLYATKTERGAYLAQTYVEAHGGACEVQDVLNHLKAYEITGGTAQRSLVQAGFERKEGKIWIP